MSFMRDTLNCTEEENPPVPHRLPGEELTLADRLSQDVEIPVVSVIWSVHSLPQLDPSRVAIVRYLPAPKVEVEDY
jgi:hypothetical protein